jgi:flagellar motor switch protein FliN/FliY
VALHAAPDELVGTFTAALTGEFIGSRAADIALVMTDPAALAEIAGTAIDADSLPELIRPAFEAAIAELGVGVLGDIREADSSALLAAVGTSVFEISSTTGPIGWLAIRLHAVSAGVYTESAGRNISRISNVEMSLTVEIGRTRMTVRELLALEPGAIVDLDRAAGAPADILLNGRLIAHGEVVVIDQDYAVRITTILENPEVPA